MTAAAKFFDSKAGQYAALGVVAVVGFIVVYKFLKGEIATAATAAGGLVTGNNALTQGTPYQGAGVAGTLGAAANAASGGVFQSIGESIGSTIFDWTHPSSTPTTTLIDKNEGIPAQPVIAATPDATFRSLL